MTTDTWEDVAAKHRAAAFNNIPAAWRLSQDVLDSISADSELNVIDVPLQCGLLSSKEIEITQGYEAVELVELLATKKLTSYEVTLAFCKRAAIAHQVTNCLTEIFFDRALASAKELDEYLEKEGKPLGPFHGLPISLKDSFRIKGISSTIGIVSFIANGPADTNSPLVDILLANGAVLYVKTNIPQTLMTADSDNNVFGRTLNPYKLKFTAGGSSGGEGALLAMRGSPIGVGTDIAGSIRIPALCCGTFGFKPSIDRVPYGGQQPPGKLGSPGIIASAGPLANSVRDAQFFLQTVISSKPWDYDPSTHAIPWHPVPPKTQLKIGLVLEDPAFPVLPPIIRALKTASERLQALNHTIIALSPETFPSYDTTARLAWAYFVLDNTQTPFKNIAASGEPLVPSVKKLLPETRPDPLTLENVFDMNQERAKISAAWHKVYKDNDLDVIIAPGAHTTACPHDTYMSAPYTAAWNLVNYPSCIIPYLKADKSLDLPDSRIPSYDPSNFHGIPAHIQVVGKKEQDEALAMAVGIIAEALK